MNRPLYPLFIAFLMICGHTPHTKPVIPLLAAIPSMASWGIAVLSAGAKLSTAGMIAYKFHRWRNPANAMQDLAHAAATAATAPEVVGAAAPFIDSAAYSDAAREILAQQAANQAPQIVIQASETVAKKAVQQATQTVVKDVVKTATPAITAHLAETAAENAPAVLATLTSTAKDAAPIADALQQGINTPQGRALIAKMGPFQAVLNKCVDQAKVVIGSGLKEAGPFIPYIGHALTAYSVYANAQIVGQGLQLLNKLKKSVAKAPHSIHVAQNDNTKNTGNDNRLTSQNNGQQTPPQDEDPNKKLKKGLGVGGAKKVADEYDKNKKLIAPSKPVEKVQWTAHKGKHIPKKNMSWQDNVNSTKHGGEAKYKWRDAPRIEKLEREVWKNGTPTNDGKPHKVMECNEIIGASDGQETRYIRVESTNNQSVIHGHPITKVEYLKLIKQK